MEPAAWPCRDFSLIGWTILASTLLAGCNGITGYTFSSAAGTGGGASSGGLSTPTYTLGGTVSGLAAGSAGFTLQDGLGDTLTVMTGGDNNPFVFPKGLPPGDTYNVTVQAQPATPPQVCRVSHGAGVIPDANITNVTIKCVTPGKYLFAVVPFDTPAGTGSVAAFTIDPLTGGLTAAAGSPYATMQVHPSDIALDPSGAFIYTSNAGSDNVSTDQIAAGGGLTLDVAVAATGAGPGTANANTPWSVAVDPTGPYLYVGSAVNGAHGAIEAYDLNGGVLTPAVGSLAASTYPAGNTPLSIAAVPASLPTQSLLFGANVHDGTLEDWLIGGDGSLTEVPGSPTPLQNGYSSSSPYAIAIYPTNNFVYITDSVAKTVSVYAYYAFGNLLTPIASYSTGALVGLAPEGLAIDPTGSFLYVANSGSGTVSAYTIDPVTGELTAVGIYQTTGSASITTPTSVRVDPSSQFLYASNGDAGTISVFSIDFTTGRLTPVGNPVAARISNGGPSSMVID